MEPINDGTNYSNRSVTLSACIQWPSMMLTMTLIITLTLILDHRMANYSY